MAARNHESSALVEASADYAVEGVEGVEQLLEYLAAAGGARDGWGLRPAALLAAEKRRTIH